METIFTSVTLYKWNSLPCIAFIRLTQYYIFLTAPYQSPVVTCSKLHGIPSRLTLAKIQSPLPTAFLVGEVVFEERKAYDRRIDTRIQETIKYWQTDTDWQTDKQTDKQTDRCIKSLTNNVNKIYKEKNNLALLHRFDAIP